MPQSVDQAISALAAYLAGSLPQLLPAQEPAPAPAPPPSLADLARSRGAGPRTDVSKVTIRGSSPDKGGGPAHGSKHPYYPDEGLRTMVWDAVKRAWVRRGELSYEPASIETVTTPPKK